MIQQGFFLFVGHLHFCCLDFFRGGGGEAEFADGEAFFGLCVFGEIAFGVIFCVGFGLAADGWAEDATGHGAEFVEFTEAVFGVECGAGGFVGEVFEGFLLRFAFAEDAGDGVAGEVRGKFLPIFIGAVANFCCLFGGGDGQLCHAFAQALSVERVDGEGSVAALGAAGAADEMRAAAAGGVGEGCVDDLEELAVLWG